MFHDFKHELEDLQEKKDEDLYEWQDDSELQLRTEMHSNLLIGLNLDENLKIISDMAFDAMDIDGSGGLDVEELKVIMDRVASQLGITGPTQDDLETMLGELDEDFDGVVSKDEFMDLIKMILKMMLSNEEAILQKYTKGSEY